MQLENPTRIARAKLDLRIPRLSYDMIVGRSMLEHISEQCWTRIESLRHRVKSICRGAHEDELKSIDAEMVELREIVFTSLKAREEAPTSS